MITLAKYLKIKREELFKSRLQASYAAGLSDSYLFHLENGNNETPGPKVLKSIAKGWGLEYMYLMTIAGYVDASMVSSKNIQKTDKTNTPLVAWDDVYDIKKNWAVAVKADEHITIPFKDKKYIATRIINDEMKDIFNVGDIIIINLGLRASHNDYVLLRDITLKKLHVRQLRLSGMYCSFRANNRKLDDFIIAKQQKTPYEVIGVVIKRITSYK